MYLAQITFAMNSFTPRVMKNYHFWKPPPINTQHTSPSLFKAAMNREEQFILSQSLWLILILFSWVELTLIFFLRVGLRVFTQKV